MGMSLPSTEEIVLKKMHPSLWDHIATLNDKHGILYLVALGKNDREIAEIIGISRSGVSKHRRKLFKQLREILEKEKNLKK